MLLLQISRRSFYVQEHCHAGTGSGLSWLFSHHVVSARLDFTPIPNTHLMQLVVKATMHKTAVMPSLT